MHKYIRSVVMIPRVTEDRTEWFSVWNSEEGHFDFVTGVPSQHESFRACATRVVSESLGLHTRDFLVSNMAQLNLQYVAVLPGSPAESQVIVSFYHVNLYRKGSRLVSHNHPTGKWLTAPELLDGRTRDDHDVCPTTTALLTRSQVIQRWT